MEGYKRKDGKVKHIDLFSGIGGFALAVDTVWPGSEHMFCDFDPFCQQILKKHWPNSKIYGDIRTITNPKDQQRELAMERKQKQKNTLFGGKDTILTGGFPCQPFSAAGKRKGTEDNRYLWPEMFRIISTFKPTWVIAENVRGLVTWNEGMVLEQVCSDLEAEGYEVQPLIIPAVAVNAPHRRDRIWFIAYSNSNQHNSKPGKIRKEKILQGVDREKVYRRQFNGAAGQWERSWFEVATKLCGVDDGLPAELDGFKLTKAGHRDARIKSLGNAIVPQVAIEIMKAIKLSTD